MTSLLRLAPLGLALLGLTTPAPLLSQAQHRRVHAAAPALLGSAPKARLRALDKLAQAGVDLGPQGIAVRAQTLAQLGQCEAALVAARPLGPHSLYNPQTLARIAACWLRTPSAARVTPAGPTALARALEQAAGPTPQRATAHLSHLAARLHGLTGNTFAQAQDEAQVVLGAYDLLDGQRARSTLRALRKQAIVPPVAFSVWHAPALPPRALAALLQSAADRALLQARATKTFRRTPAPSPEHADAALLLAQLAMVHARYAEALALLQPLAAHHLPAPQHAQAFRLLGEVQDRSGQRAQAKAAWREACAQGAASAEAVYAQVHLARALWAEQDGAGARAAVAQARARLAEDAFVVAVRDDGAAFVLSTPDLDAELTRLEALWAPPMPTPTAVPNPPATLAGPTMPPFSAPNLRAVALLIEAQAPNAARAWLHQVPQTMGPQDRLVAASYALMLEDPAHTRALMMGCDGACQALWPAGTDRLNYPAAYETLVQREAKRAHVPAALVWAIMREESGFAPHTRSARGALGLMQVMPTTARALAHAAHVSVPSREALLQPGTSVRFGSALLGELYRHFHHDVALTAAAYQAGQPRAQRWGQALVAQKKGHLVDVIALPSTRSYVRHVVAAYQRYQRIKQAKIR